MVGQNIGRYRIVRELGRGGMGVVYEAADDTIERRAAIKVLHPRFSEDRAVARRFFNEARAANIIRHPGIVSVSEFGHLPDGAAYIVMEYLDGEPLGARLQRPIGHDESLRLTRQIASALCAAHEKHIVHRDLKPDNVMLVPDPEVPGGKRARILDFGIAKLVNSEGAHASMQTSDGMPMGTPVFMAPEQCRGAAGVDDRADVYALGVMLYRMLSGRYPFVAGSPMAWMAAHLYETPLPLREADATVPEGVAKLVHEMLSRGPAERPTMAQVMTRLDSLAGLVSNPGQPAVSNPVAATPMPSKSSLPKAVTTSAPEAFAPTQSESQVTPAPPDRILSTLGQAAIESRVEAPARPDRRLAVTGGVAVALLCVGALLAMRVPLHLSRSTDNPPGEKRPDRPPPPLPIKQGLAEQAIAEKAIPQKTSAGNALPTHAPPRYYHSSAGSSPAGSTPTEVAAKTLAPAPPRVRWALTTDPDGAEVTRESDGQVLGTTPFFIEQNRVKGDLAIVLRRQGYIDKKISLNQGRDEDRHEKLRQKDKQARPHADSEPTLDVAPRKHGDDITNDKIRFVD